MSSEIQLMLFTASMTASPQVDRPYPCGELAFALAFHIPNPSRAALQRIQGQPLFELFKRSVHQGSIETNAPDSHIESIFGKGFGELTALHGTILLETDLLEGDGAQELARLCMMSMQEALAPSFGDPLYSDFDALYEMHNPYRGSTRLGAICQNCLGPSAPKLDGLAPIFAAAQAQLLARHCPEPRAAGAPLRV